VTGLKYDYVVFASWPSSGGFRKAARAVDGGKCRSLDGHSTSPCADGSAATLDGFADATPVFIHVAQKEDVAMRTYDLSPFLRSSVGFDRLFDLVNDTMNDSDNYPLYEIELIGEDQDQISLALTGRSGTRIVAR
jgi:hypothetical protein